MSRRTTSARAVIGSEARDARNTKRFMDEELEKTSGVRATPGPDYDIGERLGKSPLSTKRASPHVRIGSARRFGAAGKAGPEMSYDAAPSALGRQTFSRKKTLPAYSFGTSTRDGSRGVCSLGPHPQQVLPEPQCQSYVRHTGGCRLQEQQSIRATCSYMVWRVRLQECHVHHDVHRVQVYLSKEHGKVLYGVGTPGPMTAPATSAFQRQQISRKKTQPAYGFGSARRLPKNLADTLPGPSTYCA
jgi:hypothetical protein